MLKVAIYGKGGIGKSTITSNLAAAFAAMGKRVIQIGCDPKADSTINLLGGEPLRPVMNYMREEDEEPEELEQIAKEGFGGVLCIETGGPTPGLGCAGRGIIATFQLLEDLRLFETYKPDVVLYDGNTSLNKKEIQNKIGQGTKAEVLLGELPDEVLEEMELCVISPGVPVDLPIVERIRNKNVPVWSEIELAYTVGKGDVLAITGTNGKTTTTALLDRKSVV